MANGEVIGDINPREVIQEDPRACLSACLLSQVDSAVGLSEGEVSQILIADGLYEPGVGTRLYPACELDATLFKLGLHASPVYDARGLSEDEEPKVLERLDKVDRTLRQGKSVLLAFPKRRENQTPFLHYAVVSGFIDDKDGNGVVVMDPSGIDGGVKHPTWQELMEYATPSEGVPVMAWGINNAREKQFEFDRQETDPPILSGWNLLTNPLHDEKDTGKPIPSGRHSTSVVIPTTNITRQFAAYGDIVLSRDGNYPAGYPRFVVPPAVTKLSLQVRGRPDSLPFPSQKAAYAAGRMERTYGEHAVISEENGLFWLSGTNFNVKAWQHTGLGISSRQAQATLEGRPANDELRREVAEARIKKVIEAHTRTHPEDIYLFPTGMAAIHCINQALIRMSGGESGVQFGFPYTDSYDQRYLGPKRDVRTNILDFRDGDYQRLRRHINSGQPIRGLMSEYPSNPLLRTTDFEQLDDIMGHAGPIIIDDTVGTMYNLDDTKLPDSVVARVTSLTKYFSSVGDVMGGSIVLRPKSPYYEHLKKTLTELYEDTLWYEDAEKLADNSSLFSAIMRVINLNSEQLAVNLHEEFTGPDKPLRAVYHPSLSGKSTYDKVKKDYGGYGGLMSLRFNKPERAYPFFDALKVTKGPSFGTFYMLGCLYTRLAHKPVDSVRQFGVVPDLVRLSVGIEDGEDLRGRIEEAMIASAR